MAVNSLKGEVEIKIEGKPYTLCFTSNALVELQQVMGKGVEEIAPEMRNVENRRGLLWAGLQKHHKGVDLIAAGDLMDEADDGLQALAEALARALRFRLSGIAVDQPLGTEEE
jgi:hypothetical protein